MSKCIMISNVGDRSTHDQSATVSSVKQDDLVRNALFIAFVIHKSCVVSFFDDFGVIKLFR